MDGRAHEPHPHCTALGDQGGQLLQAEVGEPAPKTDVGGLRLLGLHPDDMLDRLEGRFGAPLDQALAREQGAVQGSSAQRGVRHQS